MEETLPERYSESAFKIQNKTKYKSTKFGWSSVAYSLFSMSESLTPPSSTVKEKKNNSQGRPPVLGFLLGNGSKHPQETSMSLHILSSPASEQRIQKTAWLLWSCHRKLAAVQRGCCVLKYTQVTDYGRYWEGSVVSACENSCLYLNFDTYKEPPFKVHPFPATLLGPMLLNPSLNRWFPTGVLVLLYVMLT